MTYRIAFSDIDGTLLNAEREASEALKTEVHRLTDQGIPFILISSRMPAAMTWIQEDLGIANLPLICYNGGWVLVEGQAILSQDIAIDIVEAVAVLNQDLQLSVQLFYADEWYAESMDFYALREQNNTRVSPVIRPAAAVIEDWSAAGHGAHKIMVMGEPGGLDTLVATLQEQFADVLHLYRSKDTYLEIASKRISKLTGIEALLAHRYPSMTLADCIAFGDNYNDIEMLQAVGKGVAVKNAKPAVLAIADAVVATNKEDGVVEGLRAWV